MDILKIERIKSIHYSLFVICYSLSTESVGLKNCSILFLILQTSKKKEKKRKEESSLLIAEENENSPEMEVVANGPSDPAAAESAEHQKEKSDKVRARFSARSLTLFASKGGMELING